jgi:hypothetical protein
MCSCSIHSLLVSWWKDTYTFHYYGSLIPFVGKKKLYVFDSYKFLEYKGASKTMIGKVIVLVKQMSFFHHNYDFYDK